MRLSTLLLTTSAALSATQGGAQEVRIVRPAPRAVSIAELAGAAADRPMIGISTSSGSRRDTLGVLITSVTEGGPAEKAGLSEGDRVQSVNGVSLKVNREDAGDDEMGGIMQRRLSRELGKLKVGDEATLQVWTSGQSRTIKVKTVGADDLMQSRRKVAQSQDDRAVVGLGYGLTGSKRDTLGVFVNSVTSDGPAEKAGVVEGDRIAAINGVSLKVPREDLEDGWAGSSRLNRMSREMAKAKPGDAVELTVVSGGKTRTVKVTTVKASSIKDRRGAMSWFFGAPEPPEPPLPPMPPLPPTAGLPMRAPAAPHATTMRWHLSDDGGASVRVEMDRARMEVERALREEMPRMQFEVKQGLLQAQKQLQAARVNARVRTVRM